MGEGPTADTYRDWIDRERTDRDIVTPRMAESLGATLDHRPRSYRAGDAVPLGLHWLLCPPRVPRHLLGPDGHPARGDFLPPVDLPRRMWASGHVEFFAPLCVGDEVDLVSRIAAVTPKSGSTGPLVFVDVEHIFSVRGQRRIHERQTVVYRGLPRADSSPVMAAPESAKQVDWTWRRRVMPDAVLLFRYSALTFNGHRIHYDHDYVRGVEGYPDLIVHGPLAATLLLDLCADEIGSTPVAFAFRGVDPAFADRPLDLRGAKDGDRLMLEARDDGGRLAMSGEIVPLGKNDT